MMRLTSDVYFLILVNLLVCFLLSYAGFWYLVFLPSAVLGLLLKSRWMNVVYFGVTSAIAVIVPIFLTDVSTRLDTGSILAAVIGIPGGAAGPLLITFLIAFLTSGLAAVATSSYRDLP
jgi:hypothetical protein